MVHASRCWIRLEDQVVVVDLGNGAPGGAKVDPSGNPGFSGQTVGDLFGGGLVALVVLDLHAPEMEPEWWWWIGVQIPSALIQEIHLCRKLVEETTNSSMLPGGSGGTRWNWWWWTI